MLKNRLYVGLMVSIVLVASLYAETEPNDNFADANTVVNGDSLLGLTNPEGDLDFFTFEVTETVQATIHMYVDGFSELDAELGIFNSDSVSLNSSDSGVSGDDEELSGTLSPGTYYVVAGYWLDVLRTSVGAYAVTFDWVPISVSPGETCATALPVVEGATNTAPLAPYWYSYTATGAGTISVSSDGATVDTYVYIYDECGASNIAYDDDGGSGTSSLVTFDSEDGVTYYIEWSNAYSSSGFNWVLTEELNQPTLIADFSADVTSGVVPLTVQFTDASTGATSWSWDFDNDGTEDATVQNPTHTYSDAGSYTVALTVSDGTSSDTEVKSNLIVVSEPAITGGWVPLSSGTTNTLESIHFPSELVGYAVGWNKTIIKTTDGGTTWTSVMDNVNYKYNYDVFFLTDDLGWVCTGDGVVYKTQDGGASWTETPLPESYYAMFTIHFSDASNGYVAGSGGVRYVTSDGGAAWTNSPVGTNNILDVFYVNETTAYLVGFEEIYKSTDGGTNWSLSTSLNADDHGQGIFFTDIQNGYAAGYNDGTDPDEGFIMQTHDGGITWDRTVMIDYDLEDVGFISSTTGFFIGYEAFEEAFIYKTVDQGITWAIDTVLGDWSDDQGRDIEITDNNKAFVVGKDGMILSYMDDSTPTTVVAEFSATPLSGTAPLQVSFLNESVGATSWSWDFDNDGTEDATAQSPSHTYTTAGSYTASLTVSDGTSTDIVTKADYIMVTDPTIDPTDFEEFIITASDGADYDYFGSGMAIHGNYAVVGAYGDDDNYASYSGSAYVFFWDGSAWTQQAKLTASDAASSDYFGQKIDIAGDNIVIGARNNEAAYVFHRTGITWTEVQKLTASDGEADDEFGASVTIEGNYLAVGAYGDDDNGSTAGAAYLFYYNGTTWVEQQKLIAGTADAFAKYGNSVSMNEGFLAVAAYQEDYTGNTNGMGAVYIYNNNGSGVWTENTTLYSDEPDEFNNSFGYAIDMIPGKLAVSCYKGNGKAYIFSENGTGWTLEDTVVCDSETNIGYGWNIALSNDYLVVGTQEDDDAGSNAGAAFLYNFDGTDWNLAEKIIPESVTEGNKFGSSVAMDETQFIIGAMYGDEDDGSAYIYTLSAPSNWDDQAVVLYDTGEADIEVRTGDVDNLGFGWPADFDPFTGSSTPSHGFPWTIDPADAPGTDRIMVVSSYVGTAPLGTDGYTSSTSRPENIPEATVLNFDRQDRTINSAMLQLFVDDFQAPIWGTEYTVTLDGADYPVMAEVLNALSQTGPIGKLITVPVTDDLISVLDDGSVTLFIDDATTGAGDGFAIDFVKLLINPGVSSNVGTITGTVVDDVTSLPIPDAAVRANNFDAVLTDADGIYILENVPVGLVLVEVAISGYISETTIVDLEVGETENYLFRLDEEVIPLVADFTANVTSGLEPFLVNFIDASTGAPTSWSWDFDNDGTEDASIQNPSYTYTTPGIYTASLTVSDGTSTDTVTKTDYITVINTNDLPEPFELLYPVWGEMVTNLQPEFLWEASSDPDDETIMMRSGVKGKLTEQKSLGNRSIAVITGYDFYLGTDSLLTDVLPIEVIGTSYSPATDLIENQVYYWTVSALDDSGTVTFSDTTSFWTNSENGAPAEFSLLLPTEDETLIDLTPTFAWDPSIDPDIEDELGYNLILGGEPDDMDTLWSGAATSLTLEWELEDNQTYYWSVFVADQLGLTTFNSGGYQSFIVNTSNDLPENFELLYPVSDEMVTNLQPEFLWEVSSDPDDETIAMRGSGKGKLHENQSSGNNSVDVITGYDFYLGIDALLTGVVPIEVVGTSYSPDTDLIENQVYYWAVSAIDDSGGETFSDTTSFWTNAENEAPVVFSLLLPTEDEILTDLTPTFTWEPSSDPDLEDGLAYNLILWSDPDDMDTLWSGAATTLTLDSNLEDNQTYYWTVYAEDWSGLVTFNTGTYQIFTVNMGNDSPSIVDLVTPDSVMVLSLFPEMFWTQATDPDPDDLVSYKVHWWGDGIDVDSTLIDTNAMTLPRELEDNTQYFWEVTSMDQTDGISYSEEATFWTDLEPEAPRAYALLSPGDRVEGLLPNVVFEWEVAADPDPFDYAIYTIEISTDSTFNEIAYESNTGIDPGFTIGDDLLNDTEYWWRVIATDTDLLTTESEIFMFTIGYVAIAEELSLPTEYVLDQNFPNPFNPSTTLRYGLPEDGAVSLVVYDIRGNTVRTIESQSQAAGWYEYTWNGMDDAGQPVSTGMYLTRFQAGSYSKVIKMLFLK